MNEAFLYDSLSHPNILKFYGVQLIETIEGGLLGPNDGVGDTKFYQVGIVTEKFKPSTLADIISSCKCANQTNV